MSKTYPLEWFSAATLAAMRLPGLPTSKVGVLQMAARQGWRRRKRQARGGGQEFHITALPMEARARVILLTTPVPPKVPAVRTTAKKAAELRALIRAAADLSAQLHRVLAELSDAC